MKINTVLRKKFRIRNKIKKVSKAYKDHFCGELKYQANKRFGLEWANKCNV